MKPQMRVILMLLVGLGYYNCIYAQSTCGQCVNAGFESGTGSWRFYTGTAAQSPTSEPVDILEGLSPTQHAIQTSGGFDPVVGGTILPVVPPGGGTRSIRIGDGATDGSKASRVTFFYNVTQNSAYFTYQYAVVLQEPTGGGNPHQPAQLPYFSIRVYDENGNSIPCGDLFVIAQRPYTNFTETKRGSNIFYRNWTKASIPLSGFVGRCVRIEFTATDCTLGDHYGYAYVDAECEPLDMIISSKNACGGYTLTGPANATDYTWTNTTVGGTTGIDGPNNTQTINVNRAGGYQLTISSPLGASCATRLNANLDTSFSNPVNFSPFTACSSVTTQFTDLSTPGGPISSWSWDFDNDGVTDNTTKNPTYNFPAAGVYPVSLTIKVGDCTASLKQDVSVNIPFLPSVEPAGPYCLNASPVKLNVNMTGGTWSGKGITNITTGIFDPSLANIGNNQIVYTSAGSCPGRDTIVIRVNAPVSEGGPNLTLCSGTNTTIGGPSTPGNTYSWSPATGLSSTSVANPAISLLNNGTTPQSLLYYVTTTDTAAGCYSSDSVRVTINSLPLVNAGNDQTICSGNSVTLSGNIAGSATSATWMGGSGAFNPTNTALNSLYSPSNTEINTGVITLTLTTNDPAGPCTATSDALVIYINRSPVVTLGADQTICVGSSINLTGSLSGSATGGIWSGGSGTFTPNSTTLNSRYTATPAEEAAGYVNLTFTTNDPTGPCNASTDQIQIFINLRPTANAGIDRAICRGSSAQLGGYISGNAGLTATWSGGSGTFTPNNKALNAIYTPGANELTSGFANLTLTTDPSGPCPSSSDQVQITINPLATANAGGDQIICVDPISNAAFGVNLSASVGGAATGGIWSGGTGGFSPSNTSPNAVYTLGETELTAASVILSYTSNDPVGPCPSASDDVTISVSQIPKVNAGLDQTICVGNTVALTGSITGSATSVTWTGGGGSFAPNNLGINTIYTPSAGENASGIANLTITTNDPPGPCSAASDQLQIIINPAAIVNSGTDQTICQGSTASLSASIGGAASNGTWNGGTGTYFPSVNNPNIVYTPSATDIAAGLVELTYTTDDPVGPCSSVSDGSTITINLLPVVNAGTVQTICSGSTVQLRGSIGGSTTSAAWSGGNGTYMPNNTTLNAIYTPSAAEFTAGSTSLNITSNDPPGPCPATSANVILTYYADPVPDFTVDAAAGCKVHCAGFVDNATVTGGNIISWIWDFGDGNTSTQQNPRHCYSNAGDFSVTLRVTDSHGCTATVSKDSSITVYELPNAAFYATPNPVSEVDPTVTFNNLSSKDVVYWWWDFGDGDTLSPDVSNPVHTYPTTIDTKYQPKLIVRNMNGCSDTASTHTPIHVGPLFSFYIPNAFTPDNGDGVNDYFFGKGKGIEQFEFWIFDRWGNVVFHGNDIDDKWDGKALEWTTFYGNNKGEKTAQRDVYTWKVALMDSYGNPHTYEGIVTLVR